MTNHNIITLKSVNELLKYEFFIPSYQRGYRWTTQQVNDLLNDLWEFTQKDNKPKDEFYCLQPVVVAPMNEKFAVIDGQQRLTTIFIILSCLKAIRELLTKEMYTLEYETRSGSEAFLKDIDLSRKNDNIDYYHICQAYQTVKEWFADKDDMVKLELLRTLLNKSGVSSNVRVIWYEVREQTDPIDIFTRLNMGKIPLTNAELIKALFLSSANTYKNPDAVRLRQLEIASEWDNMELSLRNDEFWYFLNDGKTTYDTRIEFIFDMMADKLPGNKFQTFYYFSEELKRENDIDKVWGKVKAYFLTFSEWYDNRELFHLGRFSII